MTELANIPTLFRTDDLALASILMMEGHTCQGSELRGEDVFWTFAMGRNVLDIVDAYAEPDGPYEIIHRYISKSSFVRSQMFKFKRSRAAV